MCSLNFQLTAVYMRCSKALFKVLRALFLVARHFPHFVHISQFPFNYERVHFSFVCMCEAGVFHPKQVEKCKGTCISQMAALFTSFLTKTCRVLRASFRQTLINWTGFCFREICLLPNGKTCRFFCSKQITIFQINRKKILAKILPCLLHYQDNTAVIVGLLENDVDEVANLLKDSLKQFGRTSLNYLCKEDAANFFCKFLSKDPKCPSPISITKTGFGIQLEGPPSIAEKGHTCSFCCTNCFLKPPRVLHHPRIVKLFLWRTIRCLLPLVLFGFIYEILHFEIGIASFQDFNPVFFD